MNARTEYKEAYRFYRNWPLDAAAALKAKSEVPALRSWDDRTKADWLETPFARRVAEYRMFENRDARTMLHLDPKRLPDVDEWERAAITIRQWLAWRRVIDAENVLSEVTRSDRFSYSDVSEVVASWTDVEAPEDLDAAERWFGSDDGDARFDRARDDRATR